MEACWFTTLRSLGDYQKVTWKGKRRAKKARYERIQADFERANPASKRDMRSMVALALVAVCSSALSLSGCYGCGAKQNPEELREKTAAATAQLKQDARAVAQGIREGWSRDHPLDLNKASAKDLASLPGITDETAQRIIANRPYRTPDEMLRKRVVTRQQYDKIADRITVKSKSAAR